MTTRILISALPAVGVALVLSSHWMITTAGYGVRAALRMMGV